MAPELKILRTAEEVIDLQHYLESQDLLTVDTETTGVHLGATIVGLSFCASPEVAYYVIAGSWLDTRLVVCPEVVAAMSNLLKSLKGKKLVMHNAVFDCRVIQDEYKVQLIQDVFCDTMVAAHLVDETGSNALKDLGTRYFGTTATTEATEMKQSVLRNGGTWEDKQGGQKEMYKADPEILGRYGAKDALLTFQLFYVLMEKLIDEDLTDFFFEEESMPLLRGPTYDLNTVGLRVDVAGIQKLEKDMVYEIGRLKVILEEELAGYAALREGFSVTSNQDLAWLLFVHLGHTFRALTDTGRHMAKDILGKLPYTASEKRKFITAIVEERKRLESDFERVYFANIPKIKILRKEAASVRRIIKHDPSPDATSLLADILADMDRLIGPAKHLRARINKLYPEKYIQADKEVLKDLSDKVSWVSILLKLKSEEKLYGAYILGIQERVHYGIIRPRFNQCGTPSGRYSSSKPNFQNLPKTDKRVKSCIMSRPGNVFVEADYSQLEPRVFSSISQDPRLLECFNSGKDFYSVVGIELFKRYDASPFKEAPNAFATLYSKERETVKRICLSSAYGTTANKQATILRHADGSSMTKNECQDIIDNYFEDFANVRGMMLTAHAEAKKYGKVYNIYGRPRRLPEALKIAKMFGDTPHGELKYEYRSTLNLAMNFKCQSSAASIVNRAAIAFWNRCKKLAEIDERWHNVKVVCQVHDSLVAEGPEELGADIANHLQDCMENTTTLPGVALIAVPAINRTLAGQ